jgi:hypothetical protein
MANCLSKPQTRKHRQQRQRRQSHFVKTKAPTTGPIQRSCSTLTFCGRTNINPTALNTATTTTLKNATENPAVSFTVATVNNKDRSNADPNKHRPIQRC